MKNNYLNFEEESLKLNRCWETIFFYLKKNNVNYMLGLNMLAC